MRYAILLSLLLFEPIVIDQSLYDSLLAAAHQNMRGPEYDFLRNVLQNLEQRAEQNKQAKPDTEQK